MTFDRSKIKVLKNVTMPTLSLKSGQSAYVKFVGAIYLGKELKPAKEGDPQQAPANLANVVNLETGETMQLIVSAVVKANINESYPKDGYVGKCFEIAKLAQRAGKRYFDFRLTEIEDQTAPEAAAEVAPAKKK